MRSGGRGKEHVRRNFLMPRLLRDWLRIFSERTVGVRAVPALPGAEAEAAS